MSAVSALARSCLGGLLFVGAVTSGAAAKAADPTPAARGMSPNSPLGLIANGTFAAGPAAWQCEGACRFDRVGARGEPVAEGRELWQRLSAAAVQPDVAYRLTVRLAGGSAAGNAAVIFRVPEWQQSIRSHKTVFEGNAREVEVSFTAPSFTRLPEVRLRSNDGHNLRVLSVELSRRGPIAKTQPVLSQEHSHVPPGYRLVFNDEFDGPALDRSKWFTRLIYESETLDHLKDEQQRYRDDDNHVMGDGVLRLTARPIGAGRYSSGMIRSDWTARYGYFEARVRMPRAKGVFPAFWLNSDVASDGTHKWPPEIDIFEFVNNGVEDTPDMLHTGVALHAGQDPGFVFSDPAFNRQWTFWKAPYRFDEGWHTIGAEWTEQSVTTYVDGKKIVERQYPWRYDDGRVAAKAYILLNLAVGGEWAGRYGVDDHVLPASLDIDWVRAYEKVGLPPS